MPSTDPPHSDPLPPPEVLARWRRAAESARDGLWEVFPDTGAAWFSERFAAILGFAPREWVASFDDFLARIHPEDLPLWTHAWQAAVERGAPILLQLRLRDRDGDWRWVLMRGRCWPDAQGRTEIIAGSLGDVHDERMSQQALERLVAERTAGLAAVAATAERDREAARHAEQVQSRFLAHMSHELRTPLGGLLSLVDLAHRHAHESSLRRYLELARQSGDVLHRTIDQVLDLTRLRDGEMPLADEPFDVAELAALALRSVMPAVRAKGLSVRYDWVGEPTWVRGDPERVHQILATLIGNAAKFTQAGHIAVTGQLMPSNDDPDTAQLTIDVADTGPGLPASYAGNVFDEFVQGDASPTRLHGGTGLGLPIARGLARRMGGDVALRDTGPAGSVFTLSLWLARAPDPEPLPIPSAADVMLVYQRAEIAHWLERRLERLGARVRIVDGIPAVMREAETAVPDLIVLAEHVLTDDTDLDALRRALPEATISLLIRPDWDRPALEARAAALGLRMDVMPLTARDLRLMLRAAAGAQATAVSAAPAPAATDRHVLVVEDNAVNRIIAEEFLRTLGVPSRSVESGEQALQACAESPPALVLMDLQMPVMDGLTATRELCARQRDGRLPPFPIVALTAHAKATDADACREAGMSGYLTKPLLLDTLRDELARWWPGLSG